jgi:CRP/FNR family transcriptional regulator, cyclic AMP receptor protein
VADARQGHNNQAMSESPPAEPIVEPEIVVEMTPQVEPTASKVEQVASSLARVSLFADLPAVYLRRIANLGVEETYPRGAPVFAEGTPGDKLYVILSGSVRISRQVPGMGEEALAILKTGDYFGEMALIDDFPRSADAIAHESCRLLVLTKERVADMLFVDRDLAYDLLWSFVRTLSARLRETNDKMTFLAVSSKF